MSLDKKNKAPFFYDVLDKWLVSIIDTPLNKAEAFKSSGKKKIHLLLDKAFLPLVQKISHPESINTFLYPFPCTSIDKNTPCKSLEKRSIDILFVGRLGWDDPSIWSLKTLINRPLTNAIIKKALHKEDEQIHDITLDLIENNWLYRNFYLPKDPYSSKFLLYNWHLAHFVRKKRRMIVLEELKALSAKLNVLLITNKESDAFIQQFAPYPNLTLLPFQPWEKIVELMGDTKCVINVQPFHIHGAHERILTAMGHGAIVASDKNPYLEANYQDEKEILFYDFKKGSLQNKLEKSFQDLGKLQAISKLAKHKTLNEDMPANRSKLIIEIVQKANQKAFSTH